MTTSRSSSPSSHSSLLFSSLTVCDLLLSLQTLSTILTLASPPLSDILLLTYLLAAPCLSLAIPADKAISLACPFQYHNIVTRSDILTGIPLKPAGLAVVTRSFIKTLVYEWFLIKSKKKPRSKNVITEETKNF